MWARYVLGVRAGGGGKAAGRAFSFWQLDALHSSRSFSQYIPREDITRSDRIYKASSKDRTMELKRLLRAKHLDLAWYQFNYMQKLNQADAHQYAVMMGTLESSKKQFEFLNMMKKNQVKRNQVVYSKLLEKLIIEGEEEKAEHILSVVVPDDIQVAPNDRLRSVLKLDGDQRSRMRTSELSRLIQCDNDAGAWNLFLKLKEKRLVTAYQYNTILKVCHDSESTLKLIQDMQEDGIEVTVSAYALYLGQLIIEGEYAVGQKFAKKGLPGEMLSNRAVARLVSLLSRPGRDRHHEAARMGTRELKRLTRGYNPLAAWTLFHRMKENGVVSIFHYDCMVPLFASSSEMEIFLEQMYDDGFAPTVYSYGPLVYQLIVEGFEEEASRIVHDEMPRFNITPTEVVYSYLNRNESRKSRMRSSKLKQLVKARNFDGAWSLFDTMVENDVVNEGHKGYMEKHYKLEEDGSRARKCGDGGSKLQSGISVDQGEQRGGWALSWGGALVLPFTIK